MKIEDLYENKKELVIQIGKTKVNITVEPLDFATNLKYDRASKTKKDKIMANHIASFFANEFDENSTEEISDFLIKKQPKLLDSISIEVLKLMGMNFDMKDFLDKDEE